MRLWQKSCAVLLAVWLLLFICPAVSAAENAGDAAEMKAGALLREGIPAEGETEIEFYDDLKGEKRVRDVLFVAGAALVLIGACGYLCMFIWRYTNKRRDRTKETRDGILHEIARAERRNQQQQKENEQNQQEVSAKPQEIPHGTQENTTFATMPVQDIRETPLVPSTPVALQPGEKPRVRVSAGAVPQPAQPITVRPMQSSAERELLQKPEKPSVQYDVDEILKEVREGRL